MPSLEEILSTLREQHATLSQRFPIRRMALFGSWARGDAREDSDVEILVDVDPSIGLGFVELGDELENALGRRVDLVSRRAIKPSFWPPDAPPNPVWTPPVGASLNAPHRAGSVASVGSFGSRSLLALPLYWPSWL